MLGFFLLPGYYADLRKIWTDSQETRNLSLNRRVLNKRRSDVQSICESLGSPDANEAQAWKEVIEIGDQKGRYKLMEPKSTPKSVCPEVPGIGETWPISDGCSLEDAGPAPQLLTFFAGRAVLIPADSCVHQLFETQAARTPDAVAVVFEGEQLSYRALNESANQLAHYLIRMGVGSGTRVGVFLERSPSMLVALLGILKAGAAYVPLDPIYPADRMAYMLEDAGAAVLLTQQGLLKDLGSVATRVVCLDRDGHEIAREKVETPSISTGSGGLAYVIYTSGSTGKPKGVQIEHRALVNFLHSMQHEPGLETGDRLLAVTTLSFDIAGLELFLPLICGARVILVSWHTTADGQALAQIIEHQAVTVMQATPATWRLLLEARWPGRAGLKILCGGEPLPKDLAALWNMYGPTETTIWSTCCRVIDVEDIHIGRPINNTEIYILDEQLQPAPVGVAGELLIGGEGLARGYVNRPELTVEKFIAHPYKPGARLYRTGDLARYRPDGNIDCLGRLDFQVKIRGFRIELGEIEACLARHPAVKRCVVVAREDKSGDKLLAAYFEPHQDLKPSAADVRVYLKKDLPDYMIPAAVVSIQQLPLLPNGKTTARLFHPLTSRLRATLSVLYRGMKRNSVWRVSSLMSSDLKM